ncbi:MAG: carboxypeptidase-like regulatory domain-containing protein, partial [Burkholderiales bacterium]|nr:carboxypeptidase-like regulatory domain-containing protein [Flavobacterium sp.]
MKQFLWLLFFLSFGSQAQFHLNGIVRDQSLKKPLPFASVNFNNGTYTITDVDGKFELDAKQVINTFTVSYIGFSTMEVAVQPNQKFYTVGLLATTNQLNEILVSKENPALALIRKTIQNKDRNNPQKKLNSFEFKAYNKL